MTSSTRSPDRTELASRASGGVEVTLVWHRSNDFLSIVVSDPTSGSFELVIGDGERAMDVFEHPYAYAAMRGLDLRMLVPPTGEATRDAPRYLGLAAFAGALEDWPEFADVMAEVIASRQTAGHRPPPDFGLG